MFENKWRTAAVVAGGLLVVQFWWWNKQAPEVMQSRGYFTDSGMGRFRMR